MSQDINWDSATDEALAHLRQLIRFDTTNPPGNELPLARYLELTLDTAGIETQLFEPAPGRAAVVARIRGNGTRRPVMLLAHMDVVGVDREGWSTDPFGGEVRDGFVYGRGAIDDKGMLAVNLATMLLIKRHVIDAGLPLSRDVIFVATSDEEAGGEWGIDWLLTHHPDLIAAEFAINEGGRVRVVDGRPLYAAIQTAEKVSHVVRITAHGTGGHAAIPLEDNAVARLARAVAAVHAHQEPLRLIDTTRAFFRELANVWPHATEAAAMADVASGDSRRELRGAWRLSRIPVFNAVLRTGISPTVIEGGIRHNVIPASAVVRCSVRTVPGESIDDVVSRLRRVTGDRFVDVEVEDYGTDAPVTPFDTVMFTAIRSAIAEVDPQVTVVPYLSTGATDSAKLRVAGTQAYGLLPFPLTAEDEGRMHAHDERVSVDGFRFGLRVMHGAVVDVAT